MIYKRRLFGADEEKKAKRFSYRVKGTCSYSQYLDANGNVKTGYFVEYIPKEK